MLHLLLALARPDDAQGAVSLKFVLVVQAVVTGAFLAFAGAVYATNETLATAIVSGMLTHWFHESKTISRNASTERELERNA